MKTFDYFDIVVTVATIVLVAVAAALVISEGYSPDPQPITLSTPHYLF
jgi:hypothetical protein